MMEHHNIIPVGMRKQIILKPGKQNMHGHTGLSHAVEHNFTLKLHELQKFVLSEVFIDL